MFSSGEACAADGMPADRLAQPEMRSALQLQEYSVMRARLQDIDRADGAAMWKEMNPVKREEYRRGFRSDCEPQVMDGCQMDAFCRKDAEQTANDVFA